VVKRGYEAPATRYSAGHRGIDIPAGAGTLVVAPESGTVRFAGVVVDRPTVTVQTSAGILLSIEPVAAEYAVGDAVERGSALGIVATGGHCTGACIHLGVRVAGEYVSPMRFFGGVPRAVLLPLT
jgi:murein DD-endopeptidase MepM/ murein hydrolase activator NlpD